MLRPQLNEPSYERSSSSSSTVPTLVNSFCDSSPRLHIVLFPPIPLLQIPFVTLLSMENRGRGFQLGAQQKKQEVQSGFLTCAARAILAPVIKEKLHKEKKKKT